MKGKALMEKAHVDTLSDWYLSNALKNFYVHISMMMLREKRQFFTSRKKN